MVYGYLEELRLQEASQRLQGQLTKPSLRYQIIEMLASCDAIDQDSLFPDSLGIEKLDVSVVESVLIRIWEEQVLSSRLALVGLLRHDSDYGWGVISEMLEGGAESRAQALEVLTEVQSDKSVSIACSLLGDETVPGVGPSIFHLNPVCNHAVQTLSHIVENGVTGPLYIGEISADDVRRWRVWASQLESVSVDPELLVATARSETTIKHPSELVSDEEDMKPIKPSSNRWLWFVGAVLLLGVSGLLVRRN